MQLHVYDFDGTLFRSPDEPPNHDGDTVWAMSHESLGPPCVPEVPDSEWWISEVVDEARESIADPDVIAVAITGRDEYVFCPRVRELLEGHGLEFDAVYCNNLGYAYSTRRFKLETIRELVYDNPGLDTVQIWEDDAEGLAIYKLSAQRLGLAAVSHVIQATRMPPGC